MHIIFNNNVYIKDNNRVAVVMILDYEQKYKEALEKARQLCAYPTTKPFISDLQDLFPELKENEDERIRNEIKDFINYISTTDDKILIPYESWIAWLEKQDFNYTFEIKEGHWYKCVCDYMLNNSDVMFKYGRLYYCRRDWRLDGEIDEINVKDIGVNGYKSFFRPATNQEIKDWLEKQCKQKSCGQIEKCAKCQFVFTGYCNGTCILKNDEPKFKEGDWIIFNGLTLYINEVVKGYYRTISKDGIPNSYDWGIDNAARFWTINEARDGDILRLGCIIAIFKKYIGKEKCICYCSFCEKVGFEIPIENGADNIYGCTNTTPATQKERVLLFQKMKEAGYTWDSDVKALIKL